jgi:hypothetical protein
MRILLIVVVAVAVLLASAWMLGRAAQHRAEEQLWPAGLGALKDVPRRFPAHGATPAATALNRLVEPLGLDLIVLVRPELKHDPRTVAVLQYAAAELERNETTISPPPAAVAGYFADHAEELAAVRRQALGGGPIAFAVDLSRPEPPEPDVIAIWQLCRILVADAFVRRDRAGWDDLEASWRVARPLFDRAEQDAQFVAVMALQAIAAAARRMPLPAPPWLAELRPVDVRSSYLSALQAENWRMLHSVPFPTVVTQISARIADEQRWAAAQLAGETRCAFDGARFFREAGKQMPSWNTLGLMEQSPVQPALERLFRTRAELELTDRVLAARSGAAADPRSACPDGQWLYEAQPGGATAIRFSEAMRPPARFVVTRAP